MVVMGDRNCAGPRAEDDRSNKVSGNAQVQHRFELHFTGLETRVGAAKDDPNKENVSHQEEDRDREERAAAEAAKVKSQAEVHDINEKQRRQVVKSSNSQTVHEAEQQNGKAKSEDRASSSATGKDGEESDLENETTTKEADDGKTKKLHLEGEIGKARENDRGEAVSLLATAAATAAAAEQSDVETTSTTCAELRYWKALLDEGILSQKEFEDQKQRTLRKHGVQKLRSELGEWLRCGKEVLDEKSGKELEQFYLKVAKRSIRIEGGYQEALDVHKELKAKLEQQMDTLLLVARSIKKNGDDHGKPVGSTKAKTSERPLFDADVSRPEEPKRGRGARDKMDNFGDETFSRFLEEELQLAGQVGEKQPPLQSSHHLFSNKEERNQNQKQLVGERAIPIQIIPKSARKNCKEIRDQYLSNFPCSTVASDDTRNDLSERNKEGTMLREGTSTPGAMKKGEDSEETCLKFISKVKERFPKKPHIIKNIANLVEKMQEESGDANQGRLEREIGTLFKGHPDLLHEFNQFLGLINEVSAAAGRASSPSKRKRGRPKNGE